MTALIVTGPACRLPIGGGRCAYPAGHNGDCDSNPTRAAVTDDPVLNAYRRTVKRSNRRVKQTGPKVWCDLARQAAETDHYAGANFCRNCGATDHTIVDGGA